MTTAGVGVIPEARPPVAHPSPHARHIAALCAALGALTVVAAAGDVLSPVLLHRSPAVLVLLTPRTAYLVAVAHEVPFPLYVLVAVLRLCAADPLHFMLGRTAGPAAAGTVRRLALVRRLTAGAVRRVPDRSSPLWLAAVVASPTAKTMLVAGAAGLSRRGVAVANVGGTVARVLAIWAAGRAFPTVKDGAESSEDGLAAMPRNPHLRFHNYRRGYVRCTVSAGEWRADFRTVPYVSRPGAPVETKASFVVEAGRSGTQPA